MELPVRRGVWVENPHIKKCPLMPVTPEALSPDVEASFVFSGGCGVEYRASPEMGCRDGSMHTSWQTSVMTLAVKFLSSLCLMIGRPPVGQLRAWSVEKAFPQMHLLGRWVGCQLYRMHKASRNAPLWRANPWSSMGNAESHEEAPFSLPSSIACWRWRSSCAFNSMAVLDWCCRVVFLALAFARC